MLKINELLFGIPTAAERLSTARQHRRRSDIRSWVTNVHSFVSYIGDMVMTMTSKIKLLQGNPLLEIIVVIEVYLLDIWVFLQLYGIGGYLIMRMELSH